MSASESAAPSRLRNPEWSLSGVRGQYTDTNEHAHLYRFLGQLNWHDVGRFLNVGYSRGVWHHALPSRHDRLIDRLGEKLVALHEAGPYRDDRRMVDVASGRGGPGLHACREWRLDVSGFDITPFSVQRATGNTRTAGLSRAARFAVADAVALPVRPASFPLAWSVESPAHFPDKPAFIREVARVLKPGGAFAFCDLLVVEPVATASPGNRVIYDAFLKAWDVPYLESLQSYTRTLADAGFELKAVEIATRYNLDIFRKYSALFLHLSRMRPLYAAYRAVLRRFTGAELDYVHDHVRRSYDALKLGMIDYGLFWAVRK